MAQPELPQQPSLLAQYAFAEVARRERFTSVARLKPEQRTKVAVLYLGAAAGYFASHTDDRLAQIGSRVIDAMVLGEVGMVVPNLNDDNVVSLPERARPYVGPPSGDGQRRRILYVPLNFVALARERPIEALLMILPAFCEIEASVDGRYSDNPNGVSADIGDILETFYRYAQGESPQFRSPTAEEMIARYRHAPQVYPQRRQLTIDDFLEDLNGTGN